jgi:TadE-like protein
MRRQRERSRGQAIVELALVFPLFVFIFFGIIVLGTGVFYQQQITNAAREAARFASIHSATASKPTVSWKNPASPPLSYLRYDRPEDSWPYMTAAGRNKIFGLNPASVNIAACWSGYWENNDPNKFDAPPPLGPPGYAVIGPVVSTFQPCTIDGADPRQSPGDIGCNAGLAATTVDTASDLSEGQGRIVANTVTAYACYVWSPPLAGFLLIPQTVTLRAVITEPIERQQ